MTIPTTANRVAYTGNGVTTAFSFPYKFFTTADLVVIETVIATGSTTTKVLVTDYTISGTQDATGAYPNGGTVNAVTAPPNTVTWMIYRDPSIVQQVQHIDNDPLPAASIDNPLDLLTAIEQRTREIAVRSVRLPDSDPSGLVTELPAAVVRASRALGFDSFGNVALFPTGSGVTDADSVTFLATGAGAVSTTVGSHINTVVNVCDFGCVDDGTTDNSPFLAAAWAASVLYKKKLYFPCVQGLGYAYATGIVSGVVSLEMEDGAFLLYTGTGTAVTLSNNAITAVMLRFSLRSTTGAVGLLFKNNTSPVVVIAAAIYPFTAGVPLKFQTSFAITFLGGWIRNGLGYLVDTDNSLTGGGNYVNLIRFIGTQFQQDSGTLDAFINTRNGNGWLIESCGFNGDCTSYWEIGNDQIYSGDGILNMDWRGNDTEGVSTNVVRVGHYGTMHSGYIGTAPVGVRLAMGTANGTNTNVFNLAYTSDARIESGPWPTVVSGGKNYILDASCSDVEIHDQSFNSSNVTISCTDVMLITNDRLLTPGLQIGPYASPYTLNLAVGSVTLNFKGASSGSNSSIVTSYYWTDGNEVIVHGRVNKSTLAAMTGNLTIGGLPFTVGNQASVINTGFFGYTFVQTYTGSDTPGRDWGIQVTANSTDAVIINTTSSAGVDSSKITSGSNVQDWAFTILYRR